MSALLLSELREVVESSEEGVADIEFLEQDGAAESLEGLLGKPVKGLWPFAQNGAGCLLCTWDERVVWLDSEGSPMCVVAGSIPDFISLLMLGTGAIYDIAAAWQSHREEDGPSPAENDESDVDGLLSAAAEEFPDHEKLVTWAAGHGIEPPKDPTAMIGESSDTSPSLKELLEEAGVEL